MNWKTTLALFAATASLAKAATLTENFSTDPQQNGWKIFGNTNLFHWNSTNQNLEVTWDSAQPNSYFYHPLGTVLNTNDEFSIEFDVQLSSIPVANGMQLAVGLFNLGEAKSTNFLRGTGADSPDLFEFDYFPDFLSIDASIVDKTAFNYVFFYDNQPLEFGVVYHVVLTHAPGTVTISGAVYTNGVLYTSLPFTFASADFEDFHLDTVSVSSYNDTGAFGSSILAHGTVDNFTVVTPPPPVTNVVAGIIGGAWQVHFASATNWLYTLERTTDFQDWAAASATTGGTGTDMTLQDTNAISGKAFYRVRAQRP
jgi:hypothetical protein